MIEPLDIPETEVETGNNAEFFNVLNAMGAEQFVSKLQLAIKLNEVIDHLNQEKQ